MRAPPFSFFSSSIQLAVLLAILFLIPAFPAGATGYDVSIAAKDISFVPATAYIGDTVEITAIVRNNGTTAENVAVAFYLGSTLVDSEVKPVVPISATAKGQWNTTGLAPGTYSIKVTIVAQGDTNTSNNNASASISLTKRPAPVLVIDSMQVSPAGLIDGALASINGSVQNTGDANASLDAVFLVDNVSLGKTPFVLNIGQKKNVSMAWNTSGKEGKHSLSIVLGAIRKDLPVTVGHRPRAAFTVSNVRLSEVQPTEGRSVTVTAEVTNTGDAAEEIVVVFKDNTNTFAQSKAKVFTPGESHNISADWKAKKGARVLRIEVQGHPEAVDFYTVSPTGLQSSSCGFMTIMPGMAIIAGCVCVVRWKGPGRRRAG
jgi:hypothetical protein